MRLTKLLYFIIFRLFYILNNSDSIYIDTIIDEDEVRIQSAMRVHCCRSVLYVLLYSVKASIQVWGERKEFEIKSVN